MKRGGVPLCCDSVSQLKRLRIRRRKVERVLAPPLLIHRVHNAATTEIHEATASAIHRVHFLASTSFIRLNPGPRVFVQPSGIPCTFDESLLHSRTSTPVGRGVYRPKKKREREREIRRALFEIIQRSVTNFQAKRADGLWTNSIVNGSADESLMDEAFTVGHSFSRQTRHLEPLGIHVFSI